MTIFMGSWEHADNFHRIATIAACMSIVVTAVYILRAIGKVAMGPLRSGYEQIRDAGMEWTLCCIYSLLAILAIGIIPSWLNQLVSPAADIIIQKKSVRNRKCWMTSLILMKQELLLTVIIFLLLFIKITAACAMKNCYPDAVALLLNFLTGFSLTGGSLSMACIALRIAGIAEEYFLNLAVYPRIVVIFTLPEKSNTWQSILSWCCRLPCWVCSWWYQAGTCWSSTCLLIRPPSPHGDG